MTPAWNEAGQSEDPVVELLQTLGYTYESPEKLEAERDTLRDVVLVGRTTDSEARMEVIGLSDDEIPTATTVLTEIIGDELSAEPEVNELSKMSRVAYALSPQWNLPPDCKSYAMLPYG